MDLISILYWVPSSYFEYISLSFRLKKKVQVKFPRNVNQSCVLAFLPNELLGGNIPYEWILSIQSPLWKCWWHIELNINYSEGHLANLLNYFRLLINKMDICPLGRHNSNLSWNTFLCINQALLRDVHMWYLSYLWLLWCITVGWPSFSIEIQKESICSAFSLPAGLFSPWKIKSVTNRDGVSYGVAKRRCMRKEKLSLLGTHWQ